MTCTYKPMTASEDLAFMRAMGRPTLLHDEAHGYSEGDEWTCPNGDVYRCSDAAARCAVWWRVTPLLAGYNWKWLGYEEDLLAWRARR